VYNSDDIKQQTLDLYLQGQFIGEPNWFKYSKNDRPTLVHIHGGGWLGCDKGTEDFYIYPYLELGWNAVNLNYRKGPNTAPKAVKDVLCALQWITKNAEKYRFDLKNIVITGLSAGGHLSLISALLNTTSSNEECYVGDKIRIQAVVNWCGTTDIEKLEKYLSNNKLFNFALSWVGDKDKVHSISTRYSPVNYVTANSPPILTIHGKKDTVVPFEQAEILHKKLNELNIKNELVIFPNGNHGGFSEQEWDYAYAKIFSFIEEVMK
jgi:acetyl esterase/lipase